MTPQQKAAQELSDALIAGEAQLRIIEKETKQFMRAISAQIPVNIREMYAKRAAGILGDLLEFHADIAAYDPRPATQDNGGGKRIDPNAVIE